MSVENEAVSSLRSKTLIGWYIHLCVFAFAQLVFSVFDDGTFVFKLNPTGEWVMTNLKSVIDLIPIHQSTQLNLLTILWGIVVLIHGAVSITDVFLSKRRSN
ncbi:hypothetical protein M3231_16215 [Neobacillus mesonae]|nr:hypothetical protein [Neobacillus mesonae]